jgi:catechol 2,3-dioxygenase-like lactoylglutathione lyase family enzyme
MAGNPVHFEIAAQDTSRAQKFYKDMFGWEFQSFGGPMEYNMTRITDTSGAAVFPGDPGAIRVYFDVDDINAGAARLRERRRGRRPAAGSEHGLVRDREGHRGEPDRPLADRSERADPGRELEPPGIAGAEQRRQITFALCSRRL